MTKKKKDKRPKPISLGSYTLRAVGEPPEDGAWRWRLEWYPPGEGGSQKTRAIGRHTEAAAEGAGHAAIAELAGPAGVRRGDVTTWSVLLRAWLAHVEREAKVAHVLAAATVRSYRACVEYALGVVETWLVPTGARALAEQARVLRDRLLPDATGAGLSPSSTSTVLRITGMAWRWGVREELVDPLPWQPPPLKVALPVRHVPTPAEAASVTRALERRLEGSPALYAWPLVAWHLHYATAPRVGELGSLLVEDLDLEGGAVWYGRHEGARKTGERRALLDAGAIALLRAYLARRAEHEVLVPDTPLWPVSAGTIRMHWWSLYLYPSMDDAGVPRWSAHTSRHALADAMAEAGVDEHSASAQLGNSADVRRRYYRRGVAGPLRQALAGRALLPATGSNVIRLAVGKPDRDPD